MTRTKLTYAGEQIRGQEGKLPSHACHHHPLRPPPCTGGLISTYQAAVVEELKAAMVEQQRQEAAQRERAAQAPKPRDKPRGF